MSKILTRSEFKALPLAERLIQLRDPLIFFRYCMFTRDERDPLAPIKPAPVWADEPYYKWYVEPCLRILENCRGKIFFDKSRRMFISYTILGFLVHYALIHNDCRIGVVTENATKSQEHLDNMERINESIPEDVWPAAYRPRLRAVESLLSFDATGSLIHGLASGPDQARQFGFTFLLFDEIDFWENQELTWAAAVPTTENIIAASTHRMQKSGQKSHYRKCINDEIS